MKNIYLFVGASGTGKTTISQHLSEKYGYKLVSSYTDRQPRSPHEEGHRFVTTEEFLRLKELVSYTYYNGHHYGVPAEMIDESDIFVVDIPGVISLKEKYHGDKGVKVIGLTADVDELYKRMRKRGDSREAIIERLAYDTKAFKDLSKYADILIHSDGVEVTANAVNEFISYCEKN